MFKKKRKGPEALPADYVYDVEEMLLPNRMVFTSRVIRQNDFLRLVMAIKNYPASFEDVCVLKKLATSRGITMKIILDPLTAGQISTLCDKQLQNKQSDLLNDGQVAGQIKAQVDSEHIKEVYRNFLNSNEHFYYVTVYIEAYAADQQQIKQKADYVKSLLTGYGISKDDLIFEQRPAFQSIIPYAQNLLPYLSRNMPSSTISALYPFSASSRVDEEGAILGHTTDNGPIIIDFWRRDDQNANGNISIVGESGQGKTTLTKVILTYLLATDCHVYCLDPESEYGSLITGMGGTQIDCASGRIRINPLEVRSIARDDDEEITGIKKEEDDSLPVFHEEGAFKQHLSWLRDFFKVMRPYATEAEINILLILVQDLYRKFHIDEHFDLDNFKSEDYPTIGNLYEYIRDVYQQWETYKDQYFMFKQDALQNILLFLKDAYDGSESILFNGTTNVPNSDKIDFDLNRLLQGSNQRTDAMMFNITTWIWSKVCQRKWKVVLDIDEMYLMIKRNNLTMAYYLRDFTKRARKYGAILITATQNLGDMLDPEIRHITSVLFNNPNYKFIFYPGDLDFSAVKDVMKLTAGEISLIDEPNKGKCLCKAGDGIYHLCVDVLPFMVPLFGTKSGK